MVYLDTQGK